MNPRVANPYETSGTAPLLVDDHVTSPPRSSLFTCFRFAVWLFAYLYPIWLLGSFYLIWLIAWVQLGHRPRPMLDDPMSVGGILDIGYYVPGILLISMPVLAPIGLAASFFYPLTTRRSMRNALRAAFAMLYIVFCSIALLTLRSDPGRVVEWWFD